MPRPLVQPQWRRPAGAAIAAGLVLGVGLGAVVFRGTSTSFDTWVTRGLFRHIGTSGALTLLDLSDPYLSLFLIAGVAVSAALARRRDIAAFAVLGPGLAVLLTEFALKPLFGRLIGPFVFEDDLTRAVRGSYPSGHETGVTSAALVVLVVLGQVRLSRRARAAGCVVLSLWVVLAAVGLVRNFYHYATDTIGALGFTVAVVLGVALLVDRSRLGHAPRQLTWRS